MSLTRLLVDASIAEIGAWLDGMSHETRMEAMSHTTPAEQKKLWSLAADAPPLTMDFFVPSHVPPLTPVVHHGRNTLPAFKSFRKPMMRPADGSKRLFGYNDSPTGWLLGPGYFVNHATAGNADWEARGAWVVDYFQIPDGPVVSGWPPVKPNSSGLQVLVYHKTRDFMRRVSSHVSIGAAYKVEKAMGAYFTLLREDR